MAKDKIDSKYWAGNVAKGIGLKLFDTTKEEVPNFSKTISGSINFLRGEGSTFKDIYSVIKDASLQFKKNIYDDIIIRGFGNVKKDIMKGNVYNPDRVSEAMEKSFGGGSDDGFFDDDFDTYDEDGELTDKSATDAISDKILNKTFNITNGSNGVPVDVDIKSTKWDIATNVMLHNNLLRGMQNLYEINTRMLNFNKVETVKFYNDTYTFYQKNIELLSAIGSTLNDSKEMHKLLNDHYGIGKINSKLGMFSNDKFDIVKSIKEKIDEYIGEDSLLLMAGQGLAADPLGFGLDKAIRKVLPKELLPLLNNMDKSFGDIGNKALIAAKRASNNSDSLLSMFSSVIDKFVKDNVEEKASNTNRLSRYNKSVVPFDGIVRKSLATVIPTYLRKTLNVNEHIFGLLNNIGSAIGGGFKPMSIDRTSELVFDYTKGSFNKHKNIITEVDKQMKNITKNTVNNMTIFKDIFDNDKKESINNLKRERNAAKDKVMSNVLLSDFDKENELKKIDDDFEKKRKLEEKRIEDELSILSLELMQNKVKFYNYDPTSKEDRIKLAKDLAFLNKLPNGKKIYNSIVKGYVYDDKNKLTKDRKNILNTLSAEQLESFKRYNESISKDVLDRDTFSNVFSAQMDSSDIDKVLEKVTRTLIDSNKVSDLTFDGKSVDDIKNDEVKFNTVMGIVKNNPKILSKINNGDFVREIDLNNIVKLMDGYKNDLANDDYIKETIKDIEDGNVYSNNFYDADRDVYAKLQDDFEEIIDRSINIGANYANRDVMDNLSDIVESVLDKIPGLGSDDTVDDNENLDDTSKYKININKDFLNFKKPKFDNSVTDIKNKIFNTFRRDKAPENSEGTGSGGFRPSNDQSYSRIYGVREDGGGSIVEPVGEDKYVTGIRPGEVILSEEEVKNIGRSTLDNLIKVSKKTDSAKVGNKNYNKIFNKKNTSVDDIISDKTFQNILYRKSGSLIANSRMTFKQILEKARIVLNNEKDIDLPYDQISDVIIYKLNKEQDMITKLSTYSFDARLKEYKNNLGLGLDQRLEKLIGTGKEWFNRKQIKLLEDSVTKGIMSERSLNNNKKKIIELVGDEKFEELVEKSKIIEKEKRIRGENYKDFTTDIKGSFVELILNKDNWLDTKKIEAKYRMGVSSGFITADKLMKDRVYLIPIIGEEKFNEYFNIAKDKENSYTLKKLLGDVLKISKKTAYVATYLPLGAAKKIINSTRYKLFKRNIRNGKITEDMLNNDPNIRNFIFKNGGNYRTIQSLISLYRKGEIERSSKYIYKQIKQNSKEMENYKKSKLFDITGWMSARREFKKYKNKLKTGEILIDDILDNESEIRSVLGGGVQGFLRFDELKRIGNRYKRIHNNERIFGALDKLSKLRSGDFFLERMKTHFKKKVTDKTELFFIKRKIRIGLIDKNMIIEKDFQEALINKFGYDGYMELYHYAEKEFSSFWRKSFIMRAKSFTKFVTRGVRNTIGVVVSKPLSALVRTLSPGNKVLAAKVALKAKFGRVSKDDLVKYNEEQKDGEKLYGNTDPKFDVFKTNDEWLKFLNDTEVSYQKSLSKKKGGLFGLKNIKLREAKAKEEFDKTFAHLYNDGKLDTGGVVGSIEDINSQKENRRNEVERLKKFKEVRKNKNKPESFVDRGVETISNTTNDILDTLKEIQNDNNGYKKDILNKISPDDKDKNNNIKFNKEKANLAEEVMKGGSGRRFNVVTRDIKLNSIKDFKKGANVEYGRYSKLEKKNNTDILKKVDPVFIWKTGLDNLENVTEESTNIQKAEFDFIRARAAVEDRRYEDDINRYENDKKEQARKEAREKELAERKLDKLSNQARKDALKDDKSSISGKLTTKSDGSKSKSKKNVDKPLDLLNLVNNFIPGVSVATNVLAYGKSGVKFLGKGLQKGFNKITGGRFIKPEIMGPEVPASFKNATSVEAASGSRAARIISKIKKAFGGLKRGFSKLLSKIAGGAALASEGGKISKTLLKSLKLLKFVGPVLLGYSAYSIWKFAEKADSQVKKALTILRSGRKYSYHLLVKSFGKEIADAMVLIQENPNIGMPVAEEILTSIQEEIRSDKWKEFGIEAAEYAIDTALMFGGPVGWAVVLGRHVLGINIRSVTSFINADYVTKKYEKDRKELDLVESNVDEGLRKLRYNKEKTKTSLSLSVLDGKITDGEDKKFTKNIINEYQSRAHLGGIAESTEYVQKNKNVRKILSRTKSLKIATEIPIMVGKEYRNVKKDLESNDYTETVLKYILKLPSIKKFMNMDLFNKIFKSFIDNLPMGYESTFKNIVNGELNLINMLKVDGVKLEEIVNLISMQMYANKYVKEFKYFYIFSIYIKLFKITYEKMDKLMSKVNSKIDVLDLKIKKLKESMKSGLIDKKMGEKIVKAKEQELLKLLKEEEKKDVEEYGSGVSKFLSWAGGRRGKILDLEDKLNGDGKKYSSDISFVKSLGKKLLNIDDGKNNVTVAKENKNTKIKPITKSKLKEEMVKINTGEEGEGDLVNGKENNKNNNIIDIKSKTVSKDDKRYVIETAPKVIKFLNKRAERGFYSDDMDPRLSSRFTRMAAEYYELTGTKVPIGSTIRSIEEQKRLWIANKAKADKLKGEARRVQLGKVARPGRSMHQIGEAIDSNSVIMNHAYSLGLLQKNGLYRPMAAVNKKRGVIEDWHVETPEIKTREAKQKARVAYFKKRPVEKVIYNEFNKRNQIGDSYDDVSANDANEKLLTQMLETLKNIKDGLTSNNSGTANININNNEVVASIKELSMAIMNAFGSSINEVQNIKKDIRDIKTKTVKSASISNLSKKINTSVVSNGKNDYRVLNRGVL